MLRKTIVALAAAASIGGAVALSPTAASARMGGFHGGGGFHAAHFGGFRAAHVGGGFRTANFGGARFAAFHRPFFHHRFHRFHRFARFGFISAPIYAYSDYGCWRWVPTHWGLRRVWVCGNDYY
jgi:hypothetical protein